MDWLLEASLPGIVIAVGLVDFELLRIGYRLNKPSGAISRTCPASIAGQSQLSGGSLQLQFHKRVDYRAI